jgi:hypothetical protein
MNGSKKNIFLTFSALFMMVCSAMSQPSVFKIEKLPINSPLSNDIAPTVVKDGILFCSDKRTSSFTYGTTFDDERLFNIYYAQRKDSSDWGRPREIKGKGTSLLYYGPVSLAADGKTIYFTSSIISGKAAMKRNINNPRGIFIGDLSGTEITNIRPFEYNNPRYSVAHPSISRDGKYLFFASDMPGGKGGSDLYLCENINGKWGAPVNLGDKVNSSYKENYPFIHSSGRLYFTSDKPGNGDYLGGMDIYYSTLTDGVWDTPVPMPAPVNSKSDDFALTAEDNLQTGYFTRNSGRNDEIYKFTSTIIRKASCDTLQINTYCYEFLEENALKFDTIPFRYSWNFGDGSTAEGPKVQHCFKTEGNYTVTVDVFNLVTKELKKNEKTYDMEIRPIEQPYISGPVQCSAGQQIRLDADSTYLPGWNISQYYWNFGDETIDISREVKKIYSKPGVYTIQLIVTTFPDANGVTRDKCVFKNIRVVRQP